MMASFKEYLGTIEFPVDDVLYEVGLREEAERLRGLWTCTCCRYTHATADLRPTSSEAIELAKLELLKHHEDSHRVPRNMALSLLRFDHAM
jgi:hypothetical protein